MSNRRPADQRLDLLAAPSGVVARSPAERLEPTRPVARRHRRASAAKEARRPAGCALPDGIFTLLLLVMLLAAGSAVFLQSQIEAPGRLRKQDR